MSSKVKTIAVLTSGGDAPGMNAAVRSVVRTGLYHGIRVLGIRQGYKGLMSKDVIEMEMRSVSNILGRGGTVLGSARCLEFKEDAGVEQGKKNCEELGIDGLVVIGGDGSFRGARDLSLKGIPCIGIPGTIDNDISASDYSIGFDTAVNTVMESIDRLRDTSESHNRCSVVEVMGRHCGDIALHAAINSGAVSVLVPEVPFDIEKDVIEKMQKTITTAAKFHFIVIVAEGVTKGKFSSDDLMSAVEMAKYIQRRSGIETRATVIGHIQRGGSPSAHDRVVASRMGHYAVELLRQGVGNRVVSMRDSKITDFDILEGLQMEKSIDMELYRIAGEISI